MATKADTVVIGAGIAGLGESALLSGAGLDVLTLEAAKDLGGRAYSYRRRGHVTNVGGPRVTPAVSPEGEQALEACQCDIELGSDKARLDTTLALIQEDLAEMFPGWRDEVIWQNCFHWEEPARMPGREGVFRPGATAPGVEGLWLCGDTMASRTPPGLECAADAARLCAEAILVEVA